MQPSLTQDEIYRYTRNILIPEFGIQGQRKLKEAQVLVVGAGGLGSPIALYLSAAGIGRIGIVDFDEVELSNLNRQILHTTKRIGMAKVESARQQLLELNPHVQVDAIYGVFEAQTALEISSQYDILLDGTDNLEARYILNDTAVLSRKPYVYGAVHQFEGRVSVFDARQGPCYRCVFPAVQPDKNAPPPPRVGVFGSLPGTIGTLQVLEAVKIITGIGSPLYGRLLVMDGLSATFQTIHLHKNPYCILCGVEPSRTQLLDEPGWDSAGNTRGSFNKITPQELQRKLQSKAKIQLIDVRQPVEREISQIPNSLSIPADQIMDRLDELEPSAEIILYCRSVRHASWAARQLLQAGYMQVSVLQGGINAWSQEIDSSLLQY